MFSSPRRLTLAGLVLVAALGSASCQRDVDTPLAAADSGCCEVTPNPQLAEGMGRVVVSYPDDAKSTRLEVYAADDASKALDSRYGDAALELPPGSYAVTISGRRVAGVTVQAGHDTRIRVGVLHVFAGAETRIDLLDEASGATLGSGYGEGLYGFPIGSVVVQVAGQQGSVLIEDGKVTEF